VKTATSSPSRCTWMRTPSSFHSTPAGPVRDRASATVGADPATHAVRYGNVYTQLLEYIVAADLVFYVLLVAAVMVLRRKNPEAPRPYRAWGYPLVPIIAIGLATLMIADLAWLAPATCGIGFAIVLSGFPAFLIWNRRPNEN